MRLAVSVDQKKAHLQIPTSCFLKKRTVLRRIQNVFCRGLCRVE